MSRNYKIIELDEPPSNRRVTLRELEVPAVKSIVKEIRQRGNELAFALLYGDLHEISNLLGDCVELSTEVGGIDGLSYSEVFRIRSEFKELNKDFFLEAESTGGIMAHLLTLSRPTSTAPAVSSSPRDMPT